MTQTWWLKNHTSYALSVDPESSRTHKWRGQPLSPCLPGGHLPSVWLVFAALLCRLLPLFDKDTPVGFGPIMASSAQSLDFITSAKTISQMRSCSQLSRTGTWGEPPLQSTTDVMPEHLSWRQDLSAPTPQLTVTTGRLWMSSISHGHWSKLESE